MRRSSPSRRQRLCSLRHPFVQSLPYFPLQFPNSDQTIFGTKLKMSLEQYLQTDDLTVLLGLIAVTVFLLHNLYKPQPLVHPILLGRQSDVGRVRNPKESALYRNYGTGLMGRVRHQVLATLSLRILAEVSLD